MVLSVEPQQTLLKVASQWVWRQLGKWQGMHHGVAVVVKGVQDWEHGSLCACVGVCKRTAASCRLWQGRITSAQLMAAARQQPPARPDAAHVQGGHECCRSHHCSASVRGCASNSCSSYISSSSIWCGRSTRVALEHPSTGRGSPMPWALGLDGTLCCVEAWRWQDRLWL